MTAVEAQKALVLSDGIKLVEGVSLPGSAKGLAFCANGKKAIAINTAAIESQREEAVVIAHEREHIELSALYSINATPYEIAGAERRAERAAIRSLIPIAWLMKGIFDEKKTPWDLAEEIGVTDKAMAEAIEMYSDSEEWVRKEALEYAE